jgi:hypothetical protein
MVKKGKRDEQDAGWSAGRSPWAAGRTDGATTIRGAAAFAADKHCTASQHELNVLADSRPC